MATSQQIETAQQMIACGATLPRLVAVFKFFDEVFIQTGMQFVQSQPGWSPPVVGTFDGSSLEYVAEQDMGTLITELRAFVAWWEHADQDNLRAICAKMVNGGLAL